MRSFDGLSWLYQAVILNDLNLISIAKQALVRNSTEQFLQIVYGYVPCLLTVSLIGAVFIKQLSLT